MKLFENTCLTQINFTCCKLFYLKGIIIFIGLKYLGYLNEQEYIC